MAKKKAVRKNAAPKSAVRKKAVRKSTAPKSKKKAAAPSSLEYTKYTNEQYIERCYGSVANYKLAMKHPVKFDYKKLFSAKKKTKVDSGPYRTGMGIYHNLYSAAKRYEFAGRIALEKGELYVIPA